MLAVAVIVALVGCGCNERPDCAGHYHAHRTLSGEHHALAVAAFAKWNTLAGRDVVQMVPGEVDDVTCSVRVREGEDLGLWDPEDGSISIAPDRMRDHAPGCSTRMTDCIEAVLLHETGHALGLAHTPSSAGAAVMSADGELLLEFTSADCTACRAAGVCDHATTACTPE